MVFQRDDDIRRQDQGQGLEPVFQRDDDIRGQGQGQGLK